MSAEEVPKDITNVPELTVHSCVWSFQNAKEVEKSIVQEAAKKVKEITTVGHGRAWLGIPGMRTARMLIRNYYLEA